MKKVIKAFLLIIASAAIGAGTFIALDFIENGGTAEGVKSYINDTVVPTVVTVVTALFTLYLGCSPKLKDMSNASDGLLAAKDIIGNVSQTSAATSANVNEVNKKLFDQMKLNEEQKAAIDELNAKIVVLQNMLAIGFGNMPELVKSGSARAIYALMEEKTDETED